MAKVGALFLSVKDGQVGMPLGKGKSAGAGAPSRERGGKACEGRTTTETARGCFSVGMHPSFLFPIFFGLSPEIFIMEVLDMTRMWV